MGLKFEHTTIHNFDGAIRGMRNPLNSWHKSDSKLYTYAILTHLPEERQKQVLQIIGHLAICFEMGSNDMDLALRLIKGGAEHRKFLQQIMVCTDIIGPRYFWQEFDTYRVGITKNSCSTMHTIHTRLLTHSDFTYIDDFVLRHINSYIEAYNEARTKHTGEAERLFTELKSLLPEGFLQRRTVTLNYENILNMLRQRNSHRLSEWRVNFVDWALSLPYMDKFIEAAMA